MTLRIDFCKNCFKLFQKTFGELEKNWLFVKVLLSSNLVCFKSCNKICFSYWKYIFWHDAMWEHLRISYLAKHVKALLDVSINLHAYGIAGVWFIWWGWEVHDVRVCELWLELLCWLAPCLGIERFCTQFLLIFTLCTCGLGVYYWFLCCLPVMVLVWLKECVPSMHAFNGLVVGDFEVVHVFHFSYVLSWLLWCTCMYCLLGCSDLGLMVPTCPLNFWLVRMMLAFGVLSCVSLVGSVLAPLVLALMDATWLILPVVICLSQRLSHACVSMN